MTLSVRRVTAIEKASDGAADWVPHNITLADVRDLASAALEAGRERYMKTVSAKHSLRINQGVDFQ